jgi:carnitine O-acetyltransferase
MSSKKESPKQGVTFAGQDKLPKLPIPDLDSTLKKYLESLSALQTSREQDESKAACQDFLEGEGKDLQDKL